MSLAGHASESRDTRALGVGVLGGGEVGDGMLMAGDATRGDGAMVDGVKGCSAKELACARFGVTGSGGVPPCGTVHSGGKRLPEVAWQGRATSHPELGLSRRKASAGSCTFTGSKGLACTSSGEAAAPMGRCQKPWNRLPALSPGRANCIL